MSSLQSGTEERLGKMLQKLRSGEIFCLFFSFFFKGDNALLFFFLSFFFFFQFRVICTPCFHFFYMFCVQRVQWKIFFHTYYYYFSYTLYITQLRTIITGCRTVRRSEYIITMKISHETVSFRVVFCGSRHCKLGLYKKFHHQ